MAILRALFSSADFMPHGYCYLWNPRLIRLNAVSDILIFLSYLSIPVTLLYFVRRRRDLPFNWMFVLFGVFIIACGLTHAMEVWTLWQPVYWLAGTVKALTALASVPTAILLVKLVPQALALPSPKLLKREISERVKAEEGVRKLNDDLGRRTAELEVSNKELEAFTYSVSHDLRAPLRQIDGFSKILIEEFGPQFDATAQRYLQRVREGTGKMGRLVDDLLDLARVGRQDLRVQITGLQSLVEEVVADLRPETAGRKIEWRIGQLPFVECDPALMKVVIVNLLSNAIKFTRSRELAVIEVGSTEQHAQPVVFVRDNGVGFNMNYADKLFGVFQRLHRPQDFEGTGVGLATVQRIIHKHGGRIWAEAELDKGASFYFTLGKPQKAEQGE